MISIKRAFFLISLGSFLLLAAPSAFSDEVKLRLKFHKGDEFTYKFTDIQSSEAMGMKSSQEEVRYVRQKVVGLTDETATLEMVIDRIVTKMQHPMMGDMSFDSAKEQKAEDEEGAQTAGSMDFQNLMIGKPFMVKVDAQGKVASVEGYSEIGESIVSAVMGQTGEDTEADMQARMQADVMKSMYSNEVMAMILDRLNASFPEEAVAPGAEWEEENTLTFPMMGDLVSRLKHRFDGCEGANAHIAFSGTLELKPAEASEGADAENDPMAAMRKMMQVTKSKVDGTIDFDHDRGLIKKCTQKIDLTFSMMGQEIPIHKEETMELTNYKKG